MGLGRARVHARDSDDSLTHHRTQCAPYILSHGNSLVPVPIFLQNSIIFAACLDDPRRNVVLQIAACDDQSSISSLPHKVIHLDADTVHTEGFCQGPEVEPSLKKGRVVLVREAIVVLELEPTTVGEVSYPSTVVIVFPVERDLGHDSS